MSYYYSPPPPPPPPKYPYDSPPPPQGPDCNMTKPPPSPSPPPPPPPPPPSPPLPPPCPCICPPHSPPPPPPPPPHPPSPYHPPYVVEHDYKAVIAVSVSLGGILVAFLAFAIFFLAWTKKKPVVVPPLPPTYQYGQVRQTVTDTYEDIEIQREGDGGDATGGAGGPSYVTGGPVPDVAHDNGRNNYG